MQILYAAIASIIIIYIWIRIVNTIFSEKKLKKTFSRRVIVSAIVIVGVLFVYTYFGSRIGSFAQFQLQGTNITTVSIAIFIAYCVICSSILTLLYQNRYNKILQVVLIGTVCFISIGYGTYLLGVNAVLVYTLISAYAEEYLKYTTGNNLLFEEKRKNQTDLILFCILIGLGFSFVENLLYISVSLLNHQQGSIMSMVVGRGLVSSLIHVVSTGLIAFISISMKKMNTLIIPTIA